jgi:hypothetical protein
MSRLRFSRPRHTTIVAYLALFVALGGTSYASVKIPQIAGAHQAAKSAKAGITCGGRCPATRVYWAYVGVTGGPAVTGGVTPILTSPAGGVYQTAIGGVPARLVHQGVGDWLVYFQSDNLTNCARFGNLVHDRGSVSLGGYDHFNPDPEAIHVLLTNAQGQPADLDFVVLVVCGGNAGNIQQGPAPPAAGKGGA